MEKYDVVIIGAGLGGLSSAGYLAKAGKKVLVLEHNPVPGGYAQEFRRGKFRFEAALHAMDGVGPGGWAYPILKDLEVLGNVPFRQLDPYYTACYPEHEIVAYADPLAYEAELIRHFPHEKDGIQEALSEMIDVFWQVRRFINDGESDSRPLIEQIPSLYPKMFAAQTMSLDTFFAQFFQDPKLRAVFSSLWPYYGLPPVELNAAVFILPFISYHLFGAYYPEGGSMAVSRALEKTIAKYGGEIKYRQTVNKIEINDGRAAAVITDKGLRVEADAFISNASAPATILRFIDRQWLPEEYVQKVKSEPNAVGTFCVYLGLDKDIKTEGYKHHELFVMDGYNPENDYQFALNGKFEQVGMVISNYDASDPACAPEGSSVVVLTAMAHWDTDNQWGTGGNLENYSKNPHYIEIKEAAADELIDRAEKFIPGLRKSIKYKEIATPLTNWRYSQNPGGSIYGSAQSVNNMYFNRLSAKTPIPNLFLAGAWAFAGGMSAALLSGRETSRIVNGYLNGSNLGLILGVDISGNSFTGQESMDNTIQSTLVKNKPGSELSPSTTKLPSRLIRAVGSGRSIDLSAIGKPAVLLFHGQDTADTAMRINQAIRNVNELQRPESVFIANIVDLHKVPKLFHGIAEKSMRESYEKAAKSLPAGEDPQEFVIILPDWDGSITKSLSLIDTGKTAAAAVLNASGNVIEIFQGSEPETHVLNILQKGL